MKTIPPIVLPPLSALYGAVTRTRLALYEHGTLTATKLERPVISVGNITTGGTGKTPLVEWIARSLAQDGRKVCILTRGYRRQNPKHRVLVSDGQSVFSNAKEAGDEAFLLATKLRGLAAVICDADRAAAAIGAIKHLRTDCFLLDDGFQHLQLFRDLDIVTVDATNPWGGRILLPYGRLREPLTGLKRAHCIVITRTDQVESTTALRAELNQLSGDRPAFTARLKTTGVVPLSEFDEHPSRNCGAFCAIGNSRSFYNHLRREGYEVVLEKSFRDHHLYSQKEIDAITAEARSLGAECLITTEKDAVKLSSFRFELPCYAIQTVMVLDDENTFRQLVLNAARVSA